jgi:hypothetical protein
LNELRHQLISFFQLTKTKIVVRMSGTTTRKVEVSIFRIIPRASTKPFTMPNLASTVPLLCFLGIVAVAEAFSHQSPSWATGLFGLSGSTAAQQVTLLCASGKNSDEEDDDDDDDDILADVSLGDWRKFRASLIDGGLPGENSGKSNEEGPSKKSKSVAAENEALLAQQNEKLAEEYRSGVWAHKVGQPEVGGLLCRMPLEAELYYSGSGYWKEKLDIMLALDPMNSEGEKKLDEDVDSEILTRSKVDR